MISLLPLYNPELGYKFEFVYSNKQLFLPSDLDIESYLFNHFEILIEDNGKQNNNDSIKITKDNYQEYIKDTFFRPDNLNNKSYFMKIDIPDSKILTLKYYNNTYVLDTTLFFSGSNNYKESNFTLSDIGLSVPTKYLGSEDRYIINIHIRDSENLYETIEYDTSKELKTPENIRYTYAYLGKSIFKNKIIVPNIIDKKTGDVIVFPNIPIFGFPEITETFLEVSYGNSNQKFGNNLPIIIDRYSEKLRSNNNSNNSNNSNNIENSIISNTSNILNNQNIIQPVFIKTYDLQTIYLVPNVTQNIAITGLEKFYNKVDYFLLKIGSSYQSREIGRLANNSGVVFKVTTEITNQLSSNKYHILNEKGEYITSGNIEVK